MQCCSRLCVCLSLSILLCFTKKVQRYNDYLSQRQQCVEVGKRQTQKWKLVASVCSKLFVMMPKTLIGFTVVSENTRFVESECLQCDHETRRSRKPMLFTVEINRKVIHHGLLSEASMLHPWIDVVLLELSPHCSITFFFLELIFHICHLIQICSSYCYFRLHFQSIRTGTRQQ